MICARKRSKLVLGAMVAALLWTHVVQYEPGLHPIVWGVLPWDLAYHVLWMVAAAGVVLYMTEVVWRDDAEDDPS